MKVPTLRNYEQMFFIQIIRIQSIHSATATFNLKYLKIVGNFKG